MEPLEPASVDATSGTVEVRYQAPRFGKFTGRASARHTEIQALRAAVGRLANRLRAQRAIEFGTTGEGDHTS